MCNDEHIYLFRSYLWMLFRWLCISKILVRQAVRCYGLVERSGQIFMTRYFFNKCKIIFLNMITRSSEIQWDRWKKGDMKLKYKVKISLAGIIHALNQTRFTFIFFLRTNRWRWRWKELNDGSVIFCALPFKTIRWGCMNWTWTQLFTAEIKMHRSLFRNEHFMFAFVR